MLGGQAIAQQSTLTDIYGNRIGTIQTPPPMQRPDYMAPSRQMGQQLQGILNNRRNPC